MVVFASDNGCATYTEACSNEPLLAGKLTFFEGGVRVPFLISWPGMLPSGRVIDAPISTLDVLPTALELAGAAAPSDRRLDGESLLPLLRGAATRLASERLFWRSGPSWAMRDGSWKLVQYPDRPPFLFDLAADAGERQDLAPGLPDRVAALTAAYREWDAQMIAPLWPVRVVFYAVLAEILDRKPVRLLEAPQPGTIAVEF
jgi:arylsulfatase A-like enzyme